MDEMTLTPAIRPWITEATLMRPDSSAPVVHLPDTATALVYRRTGMQTGDLLTIGPRTKASYVPGKDLPMCIRARFRPGAARRVFGVPVSELRDQTVPLTALWGERATYLEDRLNELTAPYPILRILESALLEALHDGTDDGADPGDAVLRHAAGSLSTAGERLATTARRLSISERRLRDLFTEGIGLSPKHFARIQRVRTVLAQTDGSAKLARIAADTGYYDQSHMTADFHSLMGVSPAAFRAGRLPSATPCTG